MNLRQMAARIATSIARGVLTAVNDDAPTQLVQVETYEDVLSDDVEHFQPWGVSFTPPPGAEVIILAVGGGQEHLVALAATDRDIRPTQTGEDEGGLYNSTGWKVYCHDDERVDIGAKGLGDDKLVAWAEKVEAELEKIKTAHNTHIHITDATVGEGGKSTIQKPVITYTPGAVACSKTRVT